MSDKEDVIQALVVLLLTKGHFLIDNCSRDLSFNSKLVFKMLKLLHEHICLFYQTTKSDIIVLYTFYDMSL